MADFFRGLQGGFQTGMQLGQAMRQRRMEDELARAYGLTPQEQLAREATPAELSRAQAEAQALQQQDIAEFGLTPQEAQQYAPAMPTQGARVAMPTYRLGTQTFERAPTQEQIDSARMRAAADVYGQFGDAARREELMRGLRQEERAATAEKRAQTGFETQQKEAGLRIGEAERRVSEQRNYDAFLQSLTPDDSEAVIRQKATAARLTPAQTRSFVADQLGVDKGFMEQVATRIESKLQKAGNSLTKLRDLYNSDPDFDDKTDMRFSTGRNGAVTVEFVDKESGRVVNGGQFNNAALAVEFLQKSATDAKNIGTWALGVQTKEQAIAASKASEASSRSTVDYNRMRVEGLSKDSATRGKLLDLEEQYAALTPAEQMGDKGRGLIQRYNMLAAGPGKTVALGAAPKTERPALTEAQTQTIAGNMVKNREVNPDTGKAYTREEATAFLKGGGVSQFQRDSDALKSVLPDVFSQPTAAAPAAQTAPARTPRAPAVDPMAARINQESEERLQGLRKEFSPEVQAVLDARAAAQRQAEADYLRRQQQQQLQRGREGALIYRPGM